MSEVAKLLDEIRSIAGRQLKVSGPTNIKGEVSVQGSKNSTNKLVAVTLALPGVYELHNFPLILDPLEMLGIIEAIGGTVTLHRNGVVTIDTTGVHDVEIPYALTKTTTSAFGFAGGMLGRFGHVKIGKPGGDEIGPRPVDLHSDGFRAIGATVRETDEELIGTIENFPKDARFMLRMASTGAAVNFILAVAAAGQKAYLENAPQDGDMQAMFALMRQAGVRVDAYDDGTLLIDATRRQHQKDRIVFTCWPDRNDAFTWLAYGALSAEGLVVNNLRMDDMQIGIEVLQKLGVRITLRHDTSVLVQAPIDSLELDEQVVAGLAKEFHSDWAPLLEVVATSLRGHIRVVDTLFSDRVRQAELLQKMGADLTISGGDVPDGVALYFKADPHQSRYIVDVHGPSKLSAIETAVGYDVRACAAIVMAASQAKGESILSDVNALYRGYENVIERLRSIGVTITS